MRFGIGDSFLNFNFDEFSDLYFESGEQYDVYLLDNFQNGMVMKLNRDNPRVACLSEEFCKKLCGIKTKRILLPSRPVYDEDNRYVGYLQKYVPSTAFDGVRKITVSKFISMLEDLEDDIKLLSKEGVMLGDLKEDNTLYFNAIYMFDPGAFIDVDSSDILRPRLNIFNRSLYNEFIRDEIIDRVILNQKRSLDVFDELISINENYFSEIIRDECDNKKKTTSAYFKSISR